MSETKSKAGLTSRPPSISRSRPASAAASSSYPPVDSGRMMMNRGNELEAMSNFKENILRDVDHQTTEVYQSIRRIDDSIQELRRIFEKSQVQQMNVSDFEEALDRVSEQITMKQDIEAFKKEIWTRLDGLRTEVINMSTHDSDNSELIGTLERLCEGGQNRDPPLPASSDLGNFLVENLRKELHKLFDQHFSNLPVALHFARPCQGLGEETPDTRESQPQIPDGDWVRDSSAPGAKKTDQSTFLAHASDKISVLVLNELRQLFDEHFGALSTSILSQLSFEGLITPRTSAAPPTLDAELAPHIPHDTVLNELLVRDTDSDLFPPITNHESTTLKSSGDSLYAKVRDVSATILASFNIRLVVVKAKEIVGRVLGLQRLSLGKALKETSRLIRCQSSECDTARSSYRDPLAGAIISRLSNPWYFCGLLVAFACCGMWMILVWGGLWTEHDHPRWTHMQQLARDRRL
ncbi:hypothetical protein Hypma_009888 [Hypsizygus marmoreus]|uniref:Uncharacterized protein n=1 Tax=Hypsizygus marmoreus TaxID=39966 RepID=A0A369JP01_HYPMA|nr:hypothetical protein Hypma_009888 [Hypsizygus marmoreus]